MASNDLVNFFNLMFDKRQAFDIAEGILQDKRGLTGRVSFVGNPVSQPVFIMGSAKDVSVGNRCLCVRPKTSAKWIVLGSFGTAQTGYLPQRSPEDGYEIYPPNNLTAESIIPGCCLWHWDSPPEKPIVFEIQTNTTAVESGAVTQIRTRGSYFIIDSEDNLFIRVRSITSAYSFSSWSDWVECAPGSGSGGGTGTVTSVALSLPGELAVAGSPITTSGTFTVTWNTQVANKIFAGPASGGDSVPTFRDQVLNDSPAISSQRVVGRHTAGTGHFEELALGLGLYIAASTLYASGLGGTVTSVDMTVPAEFIVTGNPVTNSGTFAVTKATQSANTVWSGPTTGSAAAPAFRALVGSDLPMEAIQDMIAAFVAQGANITITYDDSGNTLTFAVSGLSHTDISDFTESTQDVVGAFVTAGSNISATYNDVANTLTIGFTGSLTASQISDFTEAAQDAIGGLIVGGTNISATYSDAGNTLTIAFTGTLATTVLTGVLQAAQFPALTGDVTTVAGALATTLATVNSNVGSFTNASFTVNAKGLITAASSGAGPSSDATLLEMIWIGGF